MLPFKKGIKISKEQLVPQLLQIESSRTRKRRTIVTMKTLLNFHSKKMTKTIRQRQIKARIKSSSSPSDKMKLKLN